MNSQPEFLICHNGDDVEEAFDPLADNLNFVQVKEEHVDPYFEEVEKTKLTFGDAKCEREVVSDDDDDFGNDNSDWDDEPIASPKTELIEFDGVVELKPEFPSETSAKFNDLPSTSKEHKPNTESERNQKEKENGENTLAEAFKEPLLKDKKSTKARITQKVKKKIPKTKCSEEKEPKPAARKRNQGVHKCVFCDKRFVYPNDLRRHTRTHMIDKGYSCPLCGKSFARADYREHHLNHVHKGEVVDGVVRKPSYEKKCEICSKVFHHSSSFRKHMTIHSGTGDHPCTECPKTFRLDQYLQSHKKIMHSDTAANYLCSLCGMCSARFAQDLCGIFIWKFTITQCNT